ncbi:MAG TPA: 50S ribosomal protein L25/general stress protein Ctc [Caulobacterales bacterium]|nr:50S ribosomal protein L25/general stress protein Ctc [Caulobacterales bacterium]
MAGIVLSVEKREKTGTGGARATRKSGLIPGVLYGGARGSVPIELKSAEVKQALRSGKFISHLIEIDHQGEKQPVIPRAIQYHPVTDEPVHIDFYRVEEGAEIDVDVVVHFKNHEASPGLKRGGALNIVAHTLRLRVPAGKIPEEIVVDLTGLEIGGVVHLSNIQLPPGVTPLIRDRDFTIASIAGRIAEEAAPAAEAAPAEAAPAAPAKKEG